MKNKTLNSKFFTYAPGNGTAYKMLIAEEEEKLHLTWYRYSSSGVAMQVPKDGFIHYTYIYEKLSCGAGDAAPLLAFLNKTYGIQVGMPEGFDENGLFTGIKNNAYW